MALIRSAWFLSRSPNAGVINYYLPVYAAAAGCELVSGESACHDWVDETVVDWFMATSRQLADQYCRVMPSIAFVHIPIHAAAVLKKQGPGGHVDLQRHPSINDDKINGQSHGWPRNANANNTTRTGDRGGYTRRDVPFMQALVATPCLIGLFYGHNHGNTWCYRWTGKLDGLDVDAGVAGAGLHLCYGQHTDYGGYGYWVRGERQIVATRKGLRNGTLDTHTMLETGEVVGKVRLDSTFNDDVYGTVPNVKTFMPLSAGKESTSLAVTLRPALAVLALLLLL
ncbi:hypothetical protein MY4038_008575 [Beauveria bassiana]